MRRPPTEPAAPDRLAALALELADARDLATWRQVAAELDQLSGADAWRDEDDDPHLDGALLRTETEALRRATAAGDGPALVPLLEATLNRHPGDLAAPELYGVALLGTRRVVGRWLDAVEAALRALVRLPLPGVDAAARRARFAQAARVWGRSALMLSGGATWGFYHLGVVKALFGQGLLPDTLSGASTGAMIAAGVCTRDDAGLAALYADLDQIRLDGLRPLPARRAWAERAWLDPAQLREVLAHNCGPATFAEAYARSGRSLNISVSPTRVRQKPRLLNHLTSPDVLVASAALASSALPGLFPPVVLEQRRGGGAVEPYIPSERWVDGSLTDDLPKLRLARLHNVNHFIVSQTNPHVYGFVRLDGRRGLAPAVAGIVGAAARAQGGFAADLARRATRPWRGPVRQAADRAHALLSQEYKGDVTLSPRFRPELLTRVVRNPSRQDLRDFVLEGERAVWPALPRLADQARVAQAFAACLRELDRG